MFPPPLEQNPAVVILVVPFIDTLDVFRCAAYFDVGPLIESHGDVQVVGVGAV